MLYQLMNQDVVVATYEEEQRLLDYSYKLVEQQDAYLPYGFAGIDDWIDGRQIAKHRTSPMSTAIQATTAFSSITPRAKSCAWPLCSTRTWPACP